MIPSPNRLLLLLALCGSLLTACQSEVATEPPPVPPEEPAPPREGFSTNLPLVSIETDAEIPDDPKLNATMQITANEDDLNYESDPPTDYDGFVGIELRGQSSKNFPKRQYGLETRDAEGENNNVPLLGMPAENDWVLYGPYSDKSLMRNALGHDLARSMGHYASRTVFCEVVLNGNYEGVYVFMEKIKRDKNRVDIAKQEDDLSGGYLLELTRSNKLAADDASFVTPRNHRVVYEYPDGDDLGAEAAAYISDYVSAFETALYSDTFTDPETGYRAYLDVDAAVDYLLIQELFKNVDAFNASTFFYKDEGEKLTLGPVWDFNFSSGNDNVQGQRSPQGWLLTKRSWSEQLLKDPYFVGRYQVRWQELKAEGILDDLLTSVTSYALELEGAQQRNFEKWPVLGVQLPRNSPDHVFATYQEEVAYLEDWLKARIAWIDESIGGLEP